MIIEPEAQEELLEAAAWYDAQREGLGDDLLASVDELLGRIDEAPLSFPSDRLDARARRAVLGRFPYAIVFLVDDRAVRVVAFAHAKRAPFYWRARSEG